MLSAAGPDKPLGVEEFAARLDRLARFENPPVVAVAVSGGPDSLALAILADRWARRRGGEIRALCVDHRLRPESAGEVSRLAGWLAARAIPHEVLVWEDEKPKSRIQETARAARYRLLDGWCRGQGCLHLLTGHHREDQIETHLLRSGSGSGPDGLAGMPAVRELAGCRILRPLLDIPKSRLLATLAAEGQVYIDDPSNRNPAFARGRLRARPPEPDPGALIAQTARLGRARAIGERVRAALLARAVTLHPAGFAVIDPAPLLAASGDVAEPAMASLVMALGGRRYPPRRKAVARLLAVLREPVRRGHVLGGCRFVAWRHRILALRELAAVPAPVLLEPSRAVLWDRRFEAALPIGAPPLMLGVLGRDGVVELNRRMPRPLAGAPPPLAWPMLPALRDEEGLAAVPALGYRRAPDIVLPRVSLRPVNRLSHASFAVV